MEESNDSSLMHRLQAKKPFLTSPIKTPTSAVVGPSVATPERSNPNLNIRVRNYNFALSISDVRRKALQLRKPITVGSDPLNAGAGMSGSGSLKKSTSILPQKYEMLCDFFVAMVNSIRLLRMKGVPATLTKLASHIESLTDRRFTFHHLAQLKYIVPDVIMAKKIRIQNYKTKCMQEDLLLSMEMGAVEIDKNAKVGDGYAQLKKIFRSRVTDFSNIHVEDADIPEGELPHLFHQPKQEPEPNSNTNSMPLVASVISPSFKKRFSSKRLDGQVSESTPTKQSTFLPETPIKEANSSESNGGGFSGSAVEVDEVLLGLASTPAKLASIPQIFASTPSELASTPARLMAATPAPCPTKRTLVTTADDTCVLTNRLAKRRSLKFDESSFDIEDQSGMDEEENILPGQDSAIAKDDVLAVLPENLLQSLMHKEKKMLEEQNPVVCEARKRQQMMGGVPKLFDMIRLLFQSIRRNVFTKEELIYKLLSGHMDITDKMELEEQLKLLQELAPEYISEQISLSGDTLVSLNKCASPDSIRAKLLEAN